MSDEKETKQIEVMGDLQLDRNNANRGNPRGEQSIKASLP